LLPGKRIIVDAVHPQITNIDEDSEWKILDFQDSLFLSHPEKCEPKREIRVCEKFHLRHLLQRKGFAHIDEIRQMAGISGCINTLHLTLYNNYQSGNWKSITFQPPGKALIHQNIESTRINLEIIKERRFLCRSAS
jgi:hypothetical protein